MSNKQQPRLKRAIFRRLLLQMLLWSLFLPTVLVLAVTIILGLDFQWLYDANAGLYDVLKNLFYLFSNQDIGFYVVVVGLLWLPGALWLIARAIGRATSYLDDLTNAAGDLVNQDIAEITLPPELSQLETKLNRLKGEALRNEALAREAEQRKNDLVVYLAHDLKTPLTSVIGYLSLLQDEPQISPELRAKYTGVALDKAQRLEDLINEFFDITRFNLTHLELSLQEINLTRMLEQITYEFMPVLQEKELTWQLELQPDVQMMCDPDKLQRVFDNLLRNAVNYATPETAICVQMETREDWAFVQVQNQGRTIPPEKLARIFDQFFRLDSSRGTSTGGAGLGLAIAKEITELHGGMIHAESEDGWVKFTVALPLNCQKNV